jgi:hypothetical protein
MVSGLDFTAGSSLIALTLPRPSGTTLITLAGGASQVSIALPAGVPARLRLYGGASVASLDGQTRSGIAGGTVPLRRIATTLTRRPASPKSR